jgi:hypothetical protein
MDFFARYAEKAIDNGFRSVVAVLPAQKRPRYKIGKQGVLSQPITSFWRGISASTRMIVSVSPADLTWLRSTSTSRTSMFLGK